MISLSMIVRGDVNMLAKTLPVNAPGFTEKYAVVFPSDEDPIPLLKIHGFTILESEWPDSFGLARNKCLDWVHTKSNLPMTLVLDADEAIFIKQLEQLKRDAAISRMKAVALTRINFATPPGMGLDDLEDFNSLLWECDSFPDCHTRLIKLWSGIEFRFPLHEVVFFKNHKESISQEHQLISVAEPVVYHYGSCKKPSEVWLKHHNYNLTLEGKPLLKECPISNDELLEQQKGSRGKLPVFRNPHPLKK